MKIIRILSLFIVLILLIGTTPVAASSRVIVGPLPALVDFYIEENWIQPGTSVQLSPICSPSNAEYTSNSDFTWASSNSSFTITQQGVLTAPSSGGITHISITHDSTGLSRTYIIASGIIDVAMLGLKDGTDRTSYFPQVASKLSLIGFDKIYHNHASSVGPYAADILNYMQNSRILIIRSHGSGEVVQTADGFVNKNIEIAGLNNDALANLDLVIFGMCEGGYGGVNGNNILNAVIDKGAKSAIGFEDPVFPNAANDWITNLINVWCNYSDLSTASLRSFCDVATLVTLRTHPDFTYPDGELEGMFVSIRNYVVCGSDTVPSPHENTH